MSINSQYLDGLFRIFDEGHDEPARGHYQDGTQARHLIIPSLEITLKAEETGRLSLKHVGAKDPIKEMLWIYQKASSDVTELQEMGCKVWNNTAWHSSENNIAPAYGHQIAKITRVKGKTEQILAYQQAMYGVPIHDSLLPKAVNTFKMNQMHRVIWDLVNDPHSKRIATELWNVSDLDDMVLPPCVHRTEWSVIGGKLHLKVLQRSADYCVGVPYNIYQFDVLRRMVSVATGIPLGVYVHNMSNVHIYDRHIPDAFEMAKTDVDSIPETKPVIVNKKGFARMKLDDMYHDPAYEAPKYKFEIVE